MKKKKSISYYVCVMFSTLAIISSLGVIITNAVKHQSVGVGIGLLIFSILSLLSARKL